MPPRYRELLEDGFAAEINAAVRLSRRAQGAQKPHVIRVMMKALVKHRDVKRLGDGFCP